MKVTVAFNTTPQRTSYEIDDALKTNETDNCFVVTTRSGDILRFPWTAVAWARTETRA